MDSQKRLLLALGLSFLVTTIYVTFFVKPPVEGGVDAGTQVAAVVDAGAMAVPAPTALAPDAGEAMPPTPPAAEEAAPLVKIEREREQTHFTFSSAGGSVVRAEMQGPKMREQPNLSWQQGLGRLVGKQPPPPPQMDLAVPVPGAPGPLSVSIVGPQPVPAGAPYRVTELPGGGLEFTTRLGPWELKKTYQFKASFQLGYTVEVKNIGTAPASGELGLHVSRAINPANEEKGSFFGGIGNESRTVCYAGESLEHVIPSDEAKAPPEFKGPIQFFAIDQQYFLSAIFLLDAPKDGRCVLTATPTARMADAYFPLQLGPGQAVTHAFGIFIGPKDVDDLAQVPASSAPGGSYSAGLEKTVDFGIWAFICRVLLWVLKFFHGLVGNWGVAIILLTVLVKVVLLPLTHKSMVAAEAMKKLQPQMEAIRKKFAADKERQNTEMMKLYQEAKVNPLGGCLPLLFQLPIWAALFTTLRTSYDLYAEPFINPIWADLTYKDPTYILPLALGVTMIVTQKLQPQMMDATQAKIMTYGMPVFFTAIMLNYPAGLSLYIFTNNLLSIGQQYALRRYLERTGQAEPPAKKDKKGKNA